MREVLSLVSRNTKLFFKDKGMFISAMITPLILICLYVTFLANVYEDSISQILSGVDVSSKIKSAFVNGWMFSNLIAVCAVTVSFCCNLMMIQDKFQGQIKDISISPVKKYKVAIAYFISTAVVTLIIMFIALIVAFIILAFTGWYLSFVDVLLILVDTLLLTLFGTAIGCIINHFLSTQGQASAFGTAISCIYGFICGAYMPLSQFSSVLRKVLMFLPSTYGTNVIHNHFLRGTINEIEGIISKEGLEQLKQGFDLDLYFFGDKVSNAAPFLILMFSTFVLIGIYVIITIVDNKRKTK